MTGEQWLDDLLESDQSLVDLLADGFIGFSLKQLLPLLEEELILSLFVAGDWILSDPAEDGHVAVMTDSIEMFEIALRALKDRGCARPLLVHAPDDTTLSIDALPLQRPTAYNLPDGVRSHDVMDAEFCQLIQQMFADVKQIYGECAHLYRLDYGTSMAGLGARRAMCLAGEFVDLRDRAIYQFMVDGVPRRLSYSPSGRYHNSRIELNQSAGCERRAPRTVGSP